MYVIVRAGLRFVRALSFMTVPDVLQFLNILRTANSIRLCQLTTMFVSIWLTCAGVVHLVRLPSALSPLHPSALPDPVEHTIRIIANFNALLSVFCSSLKSR